MIASAGPAAWQENDCVLFGGLVDRTGEAFFRCFCVDHLSRVMRKPAFCICENKDADQLRGNRKADQRLCFRYLDSTIPLLPKSEISSL